MIRIISIQDGDTLTVCPCEQCGAIVRLRLADIDAPERGQPFYTAARDNLAAWASAGMTSIEPAAAQELKPDKLNRLVAYVWSGGDLVNAHQAKCGLAAMWTPFGPNQHTEEVRLAEAFAQRFKLGVWSIQSQRVYPGTRNRRPMRV